MPFVNYRMKESTENDDGDEISGDNPCWGGPQSHQHDLYFLLEQVNKNNKNNKNNQCRSKDPYHNFPSTDNNKNDNDTDTDNDIDIDNDKDNDNDNSSGKPSCKPLIVYESNDFLVLNKPPDLRMDGPYLATVHKLLTYWYPSPFILQRHQTNSQLPSTITNKKTNVSNSDYDLIPYIQTLAKHNSIPDNTLRPCHQLDYATSGVLLIARNKKAAAHAGKAFEYRATKKIYTTVVHGHVNMTDMPIIQSSNALWQTFQKDEKNTNGIGMEEWMYRQKKKNLHKNTFLGYMPAHSIFGKWKSFQLQAGKKYVPSSTTIVETNSYPSDVKRKRTNDDNLSVKRIVKINPFNKKNNDNILPIDMNMNKNSNITSTKVEQDDYNSLYRTFNDNLSQDEINELLNAKWQYVKKNNKYKQLFQQLTKQYNDITKQSKFHKEQTNETKMQTKSKNIINKESNKVDTKSIDQAQCLPHVFRVEGDDPNIFYVQASIAQSPNNDFRMLLQPSAIPQSYESFFHLHDNNQNLDYKPAITKCTLVSKGYYQHSSINENKNYHELEECKIMQRSLIPVTLLELQPCTGRRHQLRLHMVACGHTILGDVTYERNQFRQSRNHCHSRDSKNSNENICTRMCLHAWKLTIPSLYPISNIKHGKTNTQLTNQLDDDTKIETKARNMEEKITFIAPSPFTMEKKHILLDGIDQDNTKTNILHVKNFFMNNA